MGLNANVLKFDINNNVEDFTFILATKSYKHLGKLYNINRDTVSFKNNLNSAKEISFEINKTVDGRVEKLWDNIEDFISVYVKEVGEYFQLKVVYNDKINEIKSVTGTSLCEAELKNLNIYDMEVNTETDIDRPDYVPTVFYDESNPNASLLHRILKDKAPHYTIRYVDESLKSLQRSFSINGTSIYDFLIGECAEQFNCLFVFYSMDRSIAVYDLYTVCRNCGHRGTYNDICPECGSDFLNYFGEDTSIFVNKENLSDEIILETDPDSVKNCFKLVAGDDDMTAAVVQLNQNGTPYIYYISPEQKKQMSDELNQRIEEYDALYESYTSEYQELIENLNIKIDEIAYYEHTMMPEPIHDEESEDDTLSITEKEILNLTEKKLSPLGLTTVSTSTSIETVNSAIENYARIYVNTSLVKVEVIGSSFNYKGEDKEGWHYGIWTGTIKLIAYSDSEDISITDVLTIEVHDNYGDYLQQKVKKDIALNEDEYSVFNVLEIDDLNVFKQELQKYCLNRLQSFANAIETAMTTLMSLDQASESASYYEPIYIPYYNKLQACQAEIDIRETTISELEIQQAELEERKTEIQKALNFEKYLGEELYYEFCTHRREQEYSNSNYISDGLTTPEIMEKARDFLKNAKEELIKSATRQKSISTNLYNLLTIKEFKPLIDKFALGNFIRVQAGKDIYRLRLISYEINFSDLKTISVEFSDMTQTANGVNDVKSILDAASTMEQNFSYVSKQAEKGGIANNTFEKMYQDGLNSALYRVINNTNEDTIIDSVGITGQAYDDVLNDYSPEKYRLTHNILTFTDNNWRSTVLGLGKHNYYKFDEDGILRQYTGYGLSAQFLTAPYINNAQFIGGDIYSTNYEIDEDGNVVKGAHFDLIEGEFAFADGNLKYSNKDGLYVNGIVTANGGKIGNLTINNYGWLIHNDHNDYSVTLRGVQSNTAYGVFFITDKTNNSNPFRVNGDGSFTATKATIEGKITATDGAIGGITITTNRLYTSSSGMSANSSAYWAFWSGETNGANGSSSSNATFKVHHNGTLYATKANIEGSITTDDIDATGGTIGDWTIATTYIGASQTGGSIYLASPNDNSPYWIRTHNAASGGGTRTFSVSKTGQLYATGASISGTITATTLTTTYGTIGGININGQGLYYSGTSATDGFGIWKNGEHAHNSSYIIIHAGGNNQNIGSAPFRVYQNGNVVANNFISNSATITGGSFKVAASSISDARVKVSTSDYYSELTPYGMYCSNADGTFTTSFKFDGLYMFANSGVTSHTIAQITGNGNCDLSGTLSVGGDTYIDGTLVVKGIATQGTKSRIVETENYNIRALYCYETPSPTFGDIGEGIIDETGKCYIFIDDVFAETIDSNIQYQIFLQAYGEGVCYISERTSAYFVVSGTIGLSFGWEIKATQRDYDTMRLEEVIVNKNEDNTIE